MKPLFEISKQYASLLDVIEQCMGEITPEIEKQLEITENELQVKSKAYVNIIKSFEADINTIDSEIKRLQALKKMRNNVIERLENNIKYVMLNNGIDSIEFDTSKIVLRKSKSINIIDVSLIPDCAKKIKIEADKIKLKELFKEKQELHGCEEVINYNVNIK